ncbi:transposase [Streptomyces sp. NBC_00873]|uniref:transposase n=1 Tax=unclassified Streptomyces TaxID=2593676 RepID=UPI0038679A65|nr:transposase [Streptomyces sp. NBC_00873]WSY96641.1 transposase [Streptomyces sp. NBC_00873]WTA41585.1 transposase [Streptomyces sp. NBC_00842]WTA48311.1 transposase [Streptomyces sp. NBC_00842]
MAGRIYTPKFRADAVALWRASAGQRTMKDVAADLGITRETLRLWLRAAEGGGQAAAGGSGQTDAQGAEPARLPAQNARLLKAEKEWQLEREILRRAAQYFAQEMK